MRREGCFRLQITEANLVFTWIKERRNKMYTKKSKILAVVLCLVLLVIASGCKGNSDTQTTTTTTTTRSTTTTATQGTTEPDETADKLSIRWFGPGMLEIEDGNFIQKYIEDTFNVEIENVRADIFNAEQVSLLLASGEMPDAGFMYQPPIDLYNQGIIRTIPGELIRQYAPKYTTLMNEHEAAWIMSKAPDKDDEYLSLKGLDLSLASIAFMPMYRLDWLENVGISPKGELVQMDEKIFFTKQPFTAEEQVEIFKRFTFDDPNRSGSNDTYGISGCEYMNYSFATFMIERGIHPTFTARNTILQSDGQDLPVMISSQYKDYLTYLRTLKSEGVLDPEWTTLDITKYWEKVTSGIVGYSPTINAYVHPATTDRPPYSILLADANAKLLFTGMDYSQQWVTLPVNYEFFVGNEVDESKLKRILMIFDHINLDPLAKVKTRWGNEGEHFDWVGEPYNSNITSKLVAAESFKNGLGSYNHPIYDEDWVLYSTSKEMMYLYDYTLTHPKRLYQYRTDLFPAENNLTEVDTLYNSEINTISLEFFYRAVSGEIDLEASWDGYVDSLYDAGLQKIIDELYKMPISENLLKGEIQY